MNDKPHTHKPKLTRRWGVLDASRDNHWQIVYGDTRVKVCRGTKLPTPALVERATKKAIMKHDEGSMQAGVLANGLAGLQQYAEAVVSEWGNSATVNR